MVAATQSVESNVKRVPVTHLAPPLWNACCPCRQTGIDFHNDRARFGQWIEWPDGEGIANPVQHAHRSQARLSNLRCPNKIEATVGRKPEVALAMECNLPTTKSRLRLAREKLREKLAERGIRDPARTETT